MSLELAITENTAAIRALITVMQSGPAAIGDTAGAAAEPAKRTRRTKEQIAADEAAAAAGKSDYPLLEGDAPGTRYWVIEKHSTVYKQAPGEIEPSIEGAKIETAAHYLAKKAEFEGKAQTSAGSSEKLAESPANGASFKQVVDALMAVNSSDKPGLGTPALKAFLAKHGVERVPALEALKKNDELLAEVNALLTPAAAADADLF